MASPSDVECVSARGVSNTDRNLLGALLTAASYAAAIYSAVKAYEIAKAEWEMAKKYYNIAKAWLDYYNNYFAPVENQEITEARALEYEEEEYEVARGRARAGAWFEFRGKLRGLLRTTSRYATGLRRDMLVRLARAQADAVSLADGLGYRNERAYIETRNDVLFKRKLETAKRGRNLVSEAPSLGMASAGIYGDLLDQAWEGLKGAGTFLGYTDNRFETAYPTTYYSASSSTDPAISSALDVARAQQGTIFTEA